MVSRRIMWRFDLNQALTRNKATDDTRGIIYRLSLVDRMKGRFIPSAEYDPLDMDREEAKGIPANGDKIKSFLEIRPASAAFCNLRESTFRSTNAVER